MSGRADDLRLRDFRTRLAAHRPCRVTEACRALAEAPRVLAITDSDPDSLITVIREDDFGLWQFAHDQLEKLLARAEAAERRTLTWMRCPVDTVALWEILAGTREAPRWPRRTAARNRQRAQHALFTLRWIDEVRRHTALGTEDATRAAEAALFVGIHANGARISVIREATRDHKGGQKRGTQMKTAAKRHDPRIAQLARLWRANDELQDRYGRRSPGNYIMTRTRLTRRTIQRALKESRQ
jgi:hypothetical protein